MDLRRFFPHMGQSEPPTLPTTASAQAPLVAAPLVAPTSPRARVATAAPASGSSSSTNSLRFSPSATNIQFPLVASQYQADEVKDGIKVTPITMYKSEKMPSFNGSRIGESREYIAYGIRKPGIRILHRETFKNMLLQGHKLPVSDIHFSPLLGNMLSSVSPDGTCIVWELKLDDASQEIIYRTTVVLAAPEPNDPAAQGDAAPNFHRVLWSHTNQRMFAVARGGTVAIFELSETLWNLQISSQVGSVPLGQAGAQFLQPQNGAINDLAFSQNGEQLITCGQDGSVKTWALGAAYSGAAPLASFSPYDGRPVETLGVLGSVGLATSPIGGTQLSVWKRGTTPNYTKVQTLSITPAGVLAPVPFRWSVSPNSCYFVIAPEDQMSLVLVSLRKDTPFPRIDAAVQVDLSLPVLSLHSSGLVDGKEVTSAQDGTLDVLCIQTRTIQHFSFDVALLLSTASQPQFSSDESSDKDSSDEEEEEEEAARSAEVSRSDMIPSLGSSNQLLSPMELLGLGSKPKPTRDAVPVPVLAAVPVPAPVAPKQQVPMQIPAPIVPVPKSSKPRAQATTPAQAPIVAPPVTAPVSSVPSVSSVSETQMTMLVKDAMDTHMSDLREFLTEQSLQRSQEERERQKLLLQALAKTVQTIPQTVQVLLQDELNSPTFIDTIANAVVAKTSQADDGKSNAKLVQSVQEGVQQAITSSMGDQRSGLVKSLADATQREMSAAFRSTFADSLVPAFQAGCQEMVQQWCGAAASVNTTHTTPTAVNHAPMSVPPTAAAAAARTSAPPSRPEYGGFGDASWAPSVTGRVATDAPAATTEQQEEQALVAAKLEQVDSNLARANFEGAFYVALCSSNLQVLVATCRRVDRDRLFALNADVPVSQGILLTLLQQLSVDLMTDTELKVLWLTSVFFKLDPTDPTISEHAARYLEMLKANLESIAPQYDIPGKWPVSAIAFKELTKALQFAK